MSDDFLNIAEEGYWEEPKTPEPKYNQYFSNKEISFVTKYTKVPLPEIFIGDDLKIKYVPSKETVKQAVELMLKAESKNDTE